METYELDAYLGPAREELLAKRGEDSYDQLARVAELIENRYPDPDDQEARANALNAAVQIAVGDATLSELGDVYVAARRAERAAMEALTGAMMWADADGVSRAEIAREAGVIRRTVYRALGA